MSRINADAAESILVPIDFSPVSKEALLSAAQLAEYASRSLLVLHIAHQDTRRPNLYPRRNAREQILPIEELAEGLLQTYMADMCEQYPDSMALSNAGMMVVSGLPATRIPEIARLIGSSHIVMGSSGRGSFSRLIAGSVSDKVIRESQVPVTIVHLNGTAREYDSVEVPNADRDEPAHASDGPV